MAEIHILHRPGRGDARTLLPIVYSPHYATGASRRAHTQTSKSAALHALIKESGGLNRCTIFEPSAFSAQHIALAHDVDYVHRAFRGALSDAELKAIGLHKIPDLMNRIRYSTAGTCLAARIALEKGLAINLAGGSHHARRAAGAGYCVFNDVSVAIGNLRASGFRGLILIVDADVHQGDGTAEMFERDHSVFTFSLHAENNFPFEKATSDLDIGLPDGTGDAGYLQALEDGLGACLAKLQPALAFYNAGVDVHASDRLGRLALSDTGLYDRERMVLETLCNADVPVACVLGGGYGTSATEVAERHVPLVSIASDMIERLT